jgi:hypothetical protein
MPPATLPARPTGPPPIFCLPLPSRPQFAPIPYTYPPVPADLPRSDLFSKSDPMCILTERPYDPADAGGSGTGDWRFVGQTECVLNCQDPKFRTTLDLTHPKSGAGHRKLRFTVVDVDASPHVRNPPPPPLAFISWFT